MRSTWWVRMAKWAGLAALLLLLAACMPIHALELEETLGAVEAAPEAVVEPIMATSDLLRGVYEPPEAKILSTSDILRGTYTLPEAKILSTSDILRGTYTLPEAKILSTSDILRGQY